MPKTEHNAPGFYYLVKWRRDDVKSQPFEERIVDSTVNKVVVPDQPIYKPYEIYVLAINEVGEAVLKPRKTVGYSAEDG